MSATTRAGYLDELADELWPAPTTWRATAGAGGRLQFRVIPSAAAPRLLVPVEASLAAAAVRNNAPAAGYRVRAKQRALALALQIGVGSMVFRDRVSVDPRGAEGEPSLPDLVDDVLGVRTRWAVPVTRARANRKPVIQALDPAGRPVGFIKVGTNELTRRLVRHEADALTRLAQHDLTVTLPRVLACESWRDLTLLFLSPLDLAGSSSPRPADLLHGAREIAAVGRREDLPLRESSFWHELGGDLAVRSDGRSRELARAWTRLDAELGDLRLPVGASHGDFAPWNAARGRAGLMLWDLERFRAEVPVGWDLVHCDLQTRILRPGLAPDDTIEARRAHAASLLAPLGLTAEQSSLVFASYLVDIARRWVADRQHDLGWAEVLDGVVRSAGRPAVGAHVDRRGSDRQWERRR